MLSILQKISTGVGQLFYGISEDDRKYIYTLTEKEREKGGLIYPSDIEEPAEPDEPEDPPVQPGPDEPGEPDEPDEPIQPPAPQPDPQPPAPAPGGEVVVPWSHKKVIVALIIGLVGGLMIGCCGASTRGFLSKCPKTNAKDFSQVSGEKLLQDSCFL